MKYLLLVLMVVIMTSCASAQTQPAPAPVATGSPQVDMPNPASVYCDEKGYRSEIRTAEDGSQTGYCIFPDGTECDEWAYFRGECVPGGQELPSVIPTGIPTNSWVRTFQGPAYGAFFDVILTSDGNALAVGATNHLHVPPYSGDILVMKFNLDGDVIWEKTWGGGNYEQAWAVSPAKDGGYFIFGETDSYGSGDRDFFLLKTTADGEEVWYRTYGGEGREWPYGMLSLKNGDFLLYGFSESSGVGGRGQYALRVGEEGQVIWVYSSDAPEEELILDALETSEGDLILAVGIAEDGMLIKLDSDGKLIWEKRYELVGWQYASQVAGSSDGGYLLIGFSMSSTGLADIWLAKTASTGELEWERSFGDPNRDDYATTLVQIRDGTYIFGGIAHGVLLGLLDMNGDLLWLHYLVGQTVYGSQALIELEDGGFLVAGFIQITGGRSYDPILLRTDLNGQINK